MDACMKLRMIVNRKLTKLADNCYRHWLLCFFLLFGTGELLAFERLALHLPNIEMTDSGDPLSYMPSIRQLSTVKFAQGINIVQKELPTFFGSELPEFFPIDEENFYLEVEEKDTLYLKNVAKKYSSDIVIFSTLELDRHERIFFVYLNAYDARKGKGFKWSVVTLNISIDHIDMLDEIYAQMIFEMMNEAEPLAVYR